MNEEIRNLLEKEIETEFENLSSFNSGSKEKAAAIDDLVKLYKLRIEDVKVNYDYNEKFDARTGDEQIKRNQLTEQIKDRYFKLGIEAAGIVLPLIFYAVWMRRGFRFEETGTYTSTTFRGLFNRFKPTKK